MADVITYQRFWQRRDTAANWTAANPTLASGEFGFETDTKKLKIGDGTTAWNSLVYRIDEAPIDGTKYVRKDGAWVSETVYTDEQVRDVIGSALVAGTNVNITVDDGANTITIAATGSGGGGSGYLDPRTQMLDPMSDFIGKPPTAAGSTTNVSYGWVSPVIGGSGSITSVSGGASHPGVWRLACGINTTGRTSISMGTVNNITLGGGVLSIFFCFRVPTLSDATNRFEIDIGLRDSWTGVTAERVELFYRDNVNSGKLTVFSQVGGVTTSATGSVTLSANTFYACELRFNAAGTSVDLYVNGTLDITKSSGLPTGAMQLGYMIEKAAGTTSRDLDLDYLQMQQALTR